MVLTVALLTLPLSFGLLGTLLPALGYLPALGGHDIGLEHFGRLLAMPGIWASVWLSLASGLSTTAISVAVTALFLAAFAGTSVLRRLQHWLSPLLAIPHAAAAFGLALLIAPSGYLIRLAAPFAGLDRPPDLLIPHDPFGITMTAALVLKEIPFLFLVSLAALPQVELVASRRLAASLGYGPVAGFLYLLWPGIYRQIRFAVYAVLAYSSSVVDVALILGPNLPGTLATRLLQWMNDPDLSTRFLASAGAILQLGVTATALVLWYFAERVCGRALTALRDRGHRFPGDRSVKIAAASAVIVAIATVFSGLALLLVWSFAGLWTFPDLLPKGLTLRTWQAALSQLAMPLITTLSAGVISTLIAVFLTIGCLERETETGKRGGQSALLLLYLPLITPQITFVFGLQILFIGSGSLDRFAALVLVHLVFVLPYVFLSLSDAWRQFDIRYDVLAAALGRSRLSALLAVRLPMLTRAIFTAFAVGFAVSVGQYLPTVLIGEGRIQTITTEAVALASGGNRRVIGVYGLLQTLLPFIVFAVASIVPALLYRNRRAMQV
ncbi:ABC transporter permease [Pararhizobium antarcticum]|uniref:ABC transporter permease n=1 Tax=Pararhizobium antarcticum TaxID=1798805 RepID=A0A657LUF5_9HYPH|nr:ABC transporter permease [Pararhizobium antarcticum]OJF99709.1 ABC transporter permease [Rhizobium sp. 58]